MGTNQTYPTDQKILQNPLQLSTSHRRRTNLKRPSFLLIKELFLNTESFAS